jgi:hypothetical protein
MRLNNRWIFLLVLLAGAGKNVFAHLDGGEIGNAFVPFESKIGSYSLENGQDWHYNDLSEATNFAENKTSTGANGSFFTVVAKRNGGPQSMAALGECLRRKHPGFSWNSISLVGATGFESMQDGVRYIYLLRGPGDLVSLRMRSSDGVRSDEVLNHMLSSFPFQ